MAVRIEKRPGGRRQPVIDFSFRAPDGKRVRYRRDSVGSTKAAAQEEERRIRERIAKTSSPFEAPAQEELPVPKIATFREIVTEFQASFMMTDLKVTTRRGYEHILGILLPKLGDLPITLVDGPAASRLDLELSQKDSPKGGKDGRKAKGQKLARATRNNFQIALRSVLSFAVDKGYLNAVPPGLPRLKKIGQSILEIPSTEQVDTILKLAAPEHKLSFMIMADAGLRPNEVRALRWRDVQLRIEGTEVVGGFLSIREGISFGHTDTPKTGQREIPLSPRLAQLLGRVQPRPRDGFVALSKRKMPWGQYGLTQAFERVRDRAGLTGWSVYSLRHFAITDWLRKGVPVHVVQKMAGHSNLSTTQRYVHFLKTDLDDAARRLATSGNRLETPSG